MAGIGLTVGGWFAVSVIANLVSKARSILEEHHELHGDVVGMLSSVEDSCIHLEAVVEMAERRPIAYRSLTIWLQNIKEIAFEAENLLDDFEAKRIRKSLQDKVRLYFMNLFEKFSHVDGINKLKTLLARLDKTVSKAGSFLELIKLLNDSDEGMMGFLPTIQPVFYGREEEKEKLLSIVFPNVPQTKHAEASRMQEEIRGAASVRVVCIVGVAGVGKTSLAQVIYNHPNVKEAFDLRGWAFISHNSDFEGIVKNIIRSFAAEQEPFDSEMSLEPLQAGPCSSENYLSSIIHNKRFFLVLDNMPENPSHIWKTLSSKLTGGATGSIVLVTTTSEVIAASIEDSTRTKNRVTLGVLRTDTLSTILKHHAFGTNRKDSLESIGENIAGKLHGLPLLAEAIGRLLRMKLNEGHWRKVAENEWWDNYGDLATTNPALPSVTIIFEFLSDRLKKCLGYCSMFPSGYLFERNKLVHMWMCNSLQEHEEVVYEAMDIQWFDVLFNRSLIQPTIWKNKYTMHEVIKEFVASTTRTRCYTVEDSGRPRKDLQGFSHLAIEKGDFNVSLDLSKCSNLRSVLFFGGRRTTKLDDAVDGILPQSSALRVLDLSCIETELKRAPDVISTYSHLRFLDLSFTGITVLPDSFCGLYHLQVLGMRGCRFKKLPRDLIKLVNLRYLYAEAPTVSLIHRIGHLTNLQGLEEFAVSEIEGHRITELQDLNELGGHLCISNLDKVTCIKEVSDVKLCQKLYIQKLVLKWQPQSTISLDCMQTLFHLKPSECLEELEIQCYMGAQFPAWIADEQHFTTLRHIKLNGCEKLEILPPLGQLYHLKILILQGLNLIEEIGGEFYGNYDRVFPSLEELKFCDMTKWKSWLGIKESQTIPRLRKIEITNCSSLVKVPLSVFKGSLEDLELLDCNQIFTGNSSCLVQLEILKRLKVQNCLSTTINIPGQLLALLEVLNIQNCTVCFQGEQEHIVKFWSFLTLDRHEVQLLASLSVKVLNIQNCEVCFQGKQKHIVEFRRFLTLDCHEVHEVREGRKEKEHLMCNLPSLQGSNNEDIAS